MKLFVILLMFGLIACEDAPQPVSVWNIKYFDLKAAPSAAGIISMTTSEVKKTLIVNYAYVQEETISRYRLLIRFTTGDQLELQLSRPEGSDEYVFPAQEGVNQLDFAKFNGDQLTLLPSTVIITPKPGENKLSFYLQVASQSLTFEGNASRIPLLKTLD